MIHPHPPPGHSYRVRPVPPPWYGPPPLESTILYQGPDDGSVDPMLFPTAAGPAGKFAADPYAVPSAKGKKTKKKKGTSTKKDKTSTKKSKSTKVSAGAALGKDAPFYEHAAGIGPGLDSPESARRSRIYDKKPRKLRTGGGEFTTTSGERMAYPPLTAELAEKTQRKKRKPETETTIKIQEGQNILMAPFTGQDIPYAGLDPHKPSLQPARVESMKEMPKKRVRGPPPLTPFPEPRHTEVSVTRTSPIGGWSRMYCSSCAASDASSSSSGFFKYIPIVGFYDDEEKHPSRYMGGRGSSSSRSRESRRKNDRAAGRHPPKGGDFKVLNVRARGKDSADRREYCATIPENCCPR